MNLETFFEKFDLFGDASEAVDKLRALILHFAVTGRLSDQRDTDAPVSELLNSLSAARARLPKNGRRYTENSEADGSVIDHPILIPNHWAWVPLNEIGGLSGGMTPSKAKSAFWDGDVNWFSSKDIKTDELTESELKISREATEATGLQVYSPGCIVMVARSGILKRTFPVSILRTEGTVNQDLKVLSPFVGGLERYLQIMLRGMTDFILTSLVKTGMTVQSLKYEEFEVQPFPLPPLAEQKRIVSKVDELMALCDRLGARQQERQVRHASLARASLARFADAPTPANLNFIFHKTYDIAPADLRKSILTLAVQGKLVPQDPNDEPAEVLLRRVDAEREWLVKAKKIRRQDFLGPVDDDATPFDIPDSWQWRYLADVCFLITDGAHHTPKYQQSGVPFLSVKDVSSGTIDFSSTRYIGEDAHRELCKRCRPELGDILLTKVGTTGIAVTIDDSREFSIFVSLALLKFSQPNLDRYYLKHLINSPFVRQQSADNTQGIGNKNLVLRLINRFTVPIPPLAEQRRIVTKVDELLDLVNALENQLATARTTAETLMEAVVAELTGKHTSREREAT